MVPLEAHVLDVINTTAMNIGVHVSFEFWFSQGICPVLGLLGHTVDLFLGFFFFFFF